MSDLPADLDALVARARERFAKAKSEHELRADLDTCLDAGREDTAFLIRLELERRA